MSDLILSKRSGRKKQSFLMAKYKNNLSLNNVETKGKVHLKVLFQNDQLEMTIQIMRARFQEVKMHSYNIFTERGSLDYSSEFEMLYYSELLMDMI